MEAGKPAGASTGVLADALGEDHVRSEAEQARYERDELLAISRALASERDIKKLLGLVLEKCRQITGADAGSVYVVEDDDSGKRLRFMLSQNDSVKVDFQEFTIAVDASSIVGRAVLDAKPINIPDLTNLESGPRGFRHNRSFDEKTGYRARSMLTVPMLSAQDEVIGVIQLINKKRRASRLLRAQADFDREVIPFDERSETLAFALAAQGGISLENTALYQEIRDLFEGFVDASVTAIESRDPTTSGHSRRVATLSVALAERVDAISAGPLADVHFSRDDLRQIEYAGVLHDFGKVGVRENVLVKAKKLYDAQRDAIRLRFDFIIKSLEAEALGRKLAVTQKHGPTAEEALRELNAIELDLAERVAEIETLWTAVVQANEPTVLAAPAREKLDELGRRTYLDARGIVRPYLQEDEIKALEIPRGSLTELERREIESHVTHTIQFLEAIPWGRALCKIPRIAGAHHESLDGRGYPHRLGGEDIPIETRMLTISDIFDALTASDRPYKPAVPVPRALDIIGSEVKVGRVDARLFDVFIEAEIWRKVVTS